MAKFIHFTIQEGIAMLILNNPEKLNSFNLQMHQEILEALTKVNADPTVRVLVLTGSGRAFSAGQDLGAPEVQFLENGDAPDFEAVVKNQYKPLILALRNLNVPTIAAVNGVAAGAGASVAFACDIVVAKKSASFIQSFSQIGLIPDTGGTWFLPKLIGLPRAMGLTMLGDKLSAEKAAEWGLIWQVIEDDSFEKEVKELASKLEKMPTKALIKIRSLISLGEVHTLDQQLDLEAKAMGELGRSLDFKEGVTAFKEKRQPQFTGA